MYTHIAMQAQMEDIRAPIIYLATMRPRLNSHKQSPTQDNVYDGALCF